MAQSQSEQILKHLREVGPLTPLEALDRFSCFRLAARVNDLRADGYDIRTNLIELANGKKVASYWLPKGQLSLFQTKAPVGEVSSGALGFALADAPKRDRESLTSSIETSRCSA